MEKTKPGHFAFPAAPDGAEALKTIGQLWDEGLDSGPAIDGPEALEKVRQTLNSARFASGPPSLP